MRYLRSLLLVAVGCAVGWFPSSADAGPFGIFGKKNCPECELRVTDKGRGDYNAKGAYTGEVPQSYFDSYSGSDANKTDEPTPAAPEPAEISIVVVPAPPVQEAAGTDTEVTAEAVELTQEAYAQAQDAHEAALNAEQREKERLAADLRQQIASLTEQLQSLEPTAEE